MPPVAHIDHVRVLGMKEVNGVVTELIRSVMVTGMTEDDYRVLPVALQTAGIPIAGTMLTGTEFSELVLAEREVKLERTDPDTCFVVLTYRHFLEGNNQDITPLARYRKLHGRMRCYLQEMTTNFITHINTDGLVKREAVIVQYQYPKTHRKHAKQLQTQGGEIRVMFAAKNYRFGGYLDTNAPWTFANFWLRRINAVPWMHEPAFTWMVTEVDWTRMGPGRYAMHIECQNNPDSWLPQVVFIDPDTGRPPPDLIDGIGKKTIHYHPEANFTQMFGTLIEGWLD